MTDAAIEVAMSDSVDILHRHLTIRLAVPNAICRWRAETFSTKEPETLAWIDGLPEGAIVWDIGANVGLYSIYAALSRNCRVISFEPSVFNLELLARNLFLNRLGDRVSIVPLALSDRLGSSELRMTTTDWGGALSTFGQNFGWDGEAINEVFGFRTLGITMADAIGSLQIPQPDFIKMDVDGIEHLILAGGPDVLKATQGVLVEINDAFPEQAEKSAYWLGRAGLVFKEKRHAEMFDEPESALATSYNQIWIRR